MARFENSGKRKEKRNFNDDYPKRDRGHKRSFEDFGKGDKRNFRRDYKDYGRKRRNVEMTKVICSSCGKECEVPFKPDLTKPVYCDECFAKRNKTGSDNSSDRNFDLINKKLDKIMKALKIE